MMNFNKTSFFFIAVFFFALCSFSLKSNINDDKVTIVALLKKSKDYYDKQKVFKFNTAYDLFAGNSKKAIESYKGVFIKDDKNFYSKIGQTEIIVIKGNTIKIDNESKLIQYFKEEATNENIVYDLVKYCNNFGTFDLKSTDNYWICTLNSREVTFVPYSKVVIYLDKKNYSIVKQELFLISTITTKDVKGKDVYSYPKLQITFSAFELKKQNEDYFKINYYIELKKGKYYPSKKYSTYQIVE